MEKYVETLPWVNATLSIVLSFSLFWAAISCGRCTTVILDLARAREYVSSSENTFLFYRAKSQPLNALKVNDVNTDTSCLAKTPNSRRRGV